MNIRERFEEIWPVPFGVYWSDASGAYWFRVESHEPTRMSAEMNIRIDTFTRCQETTDVYVSLIVQLVDELDQALVDAYHWTPPRTQEILDRAKQIMEQKK